MVECVEIAVVIEVVDIVTDTNESSLNANENGCYDYDCFKHAIKASSKIAGEQFGGQNGCYKIFLFKIVGSIGDLISLILHNVFS